MYFGTASFFIFPCAAGRFLGRGVGKAGVMFEYPQILSTFEAKMKQARVYHGQRTLHDWVVEGRLQEAL